ncbi:MoxR family ATPase [Clostridium sp. D2Q-11]|uniref:MoxR family ATPase n=1 Tax=Anaeromonas frigoriresistens TaxID=2683708 RepID=A0A942USI4_9FIRM|nr:MoxR family ATPase [Anaeromonas frigoriresistens]MBS4537793.1 MoxR family ATPase [Anaeromonas frigoriresistens]
MNKKIELLIENISKVIFGKRKEIINIVTCLLAEGHILLEDMPGVGKTTLVHALAKSIDSDFGRIQFTPDLLPSDITGVSIFNPKLSKFEFNKGPVFTNILLADEINRTSPKTQSSLLEAMQEGQVTVEGKTFLLDDPFMVLATENPIEYEGTFPLPEAQLDRFMMKMSIGYPDNESEKNILRNFSSSTPLEKLTPIMSLTDITEIKKEVNKVFVSEEIEDIIIGLADNTRNHPDINLGISPRGSLLLYKASKAFAYINGRDYVIPDDIKKLYLDVFSHRVILKPEARLNDVNTEEVLKRIFSKLKI